jgi:uncharacterized protein YigA (DUF484 family)
MSDEYPSETETETMGGFKLDGFIPLVILCVSFIVLLGWQVSVASSQRTMLENAITRQEPSVTQSQQIQASVTKLVTDLLQAAQTDDTAKKIVDKYKIQQNAPAASPAP